MLCSLNPTNIVKETNYNIISKHGWGDKKGILMEKKDEKINKLNNSTGFCCCLIEINYHNNVVVYTC